jgi:4-oxalocrotonate tautomerase
MPMICVKIAPLQAHDGLEEQVAQLVAAASSGILRKDPRVTAIAVERVEPSHWFTGGTSLAAQRKASFWLDIKVTDGTNSKDEKAAFITHIFAAMGRLLGELHEESYVYVDEVRGDAYGYGGKTQEHRYIAGKLGPA